MAAAPIVLKELLFLTQGTVCKPSWHGRKENHGAGCRALCTHAGFSSIRASIACLSGVAHFMLRLHALDKSGLQPLIPFTVDVLGSVPSPQSPSQDLSSQGLPESHR